MIINIWIVVTSANLVMFLNNGRVTRTRSFGCWQEVFKYLRDHAPMNYELTHVQIASKTF